MSKFTRHPNTKPKTRAKAIFYGKHTVRAALQRHEWRLARPGKIAERQIHQQAREMRNLEARAWAESPTLGLSP